jgi:hypothetical protein
VKRAALGVAAAAALASGGAACARPDPAAPVGSHANPIRCSGKPDELDYLARLRCPDGAAAHWRRAGASGNSSAGTTQSLYRVRCTQLNWETTIHFDRRRSPRDEQPAPAGLELAPAAPTPSCRIPGRCN